MPCSWRSPERRTRSRRRPTDSWRSPGRSWPPGVEVRVRVGIHSGEPLAVPPNYVGMDVHRAARIMAAGHGGQVLVSGTTRALLDGVELIDLGPHRLKDMLEPIHLYQLVIDGLPREFPPLKSLHRSNLPIAAWPILGRDEELAALRSLVSDGARLDHAHGPGRDGQDAAGAPGCGRALGCASPAAPSSSPLAALRESAGVTPGSRKRSASARRRCERAAPLGARAAGPRQPRAAAATSPSVVAGLLVGDTVVLATSRAPLHLSAERELAGPAARRGVRRRAVPEPRGSRGAALRGRPNRRGDLPSARQPAARDRARRRRTRLLTPGGAPRTPRLVPADPVGRRP